MKFFTAYTRFVVIGGADLKQTEIIDLTDPSLTCTSSTFGDLETVRIQAMGGLIIETPILCGGRDSNRDRFDSCILFGQTKTSIKLKEKRSGAASVMLNEETLWILGGRRTDESYITSTELISLDADFSVYGPSMPNELSNLCAVKYNESHIYLTGGYNYDSGGETNKVWIFNKVTTAWTEGPLMINKRAWHGCTILHHEQGSWIVVSGGTLWDEEEKLSLVMAGNQNLCKWVLFVKPMTIKFQKPFFKLSPP